MSMSSTRAWIEAFRLRTLPLALASIGMGSFLAGFNGKFRWSVFLLASLTTVSLQILSNLANDYGDTRHGADHAERSGPSRAVQSGSITPQAMKKGIYFFIFFSLLSGIALLLVAFPTFDPAFFLLLLLGLLAIGAAVNYTMGKNPYGYAGFGDLFVLIFFGFAGVGGTYFCHTGTFDASVIWPSLSSGLLATAVLNINNIRDITSDKKAGKMSVPVRIGRKKAVIYHWFLIVTALIAAGIYVEGHYHSPWQWMFLLSAPLLLYNAIKVQKTHDPALLDPLLRQLALSALLFTVLFGIGNLL